MNYKEAWEELRQTAKGKIEECNRQLHHLQPDDHMREQGISNAAVAFMFIVQLMERLEKDYEEEKA